MKNLIPRLRQFRARAHVNPFSKSSLPFPPNHLYVDWKQHFPLKFGGSKELNISPHCNTITFPSDYSNPRNYSMQGRNIDILDIGCGYGGLLFSLAPLFPCKLILGLQIRQTVTNYVGQKIKAYRMIYPEAYDNISVVQTNTMRYLCNYIPKSSVQKIFICFPDPHFKPKNHKRRIINTGFLSQYAYLLKPQGLLYCITDVEELHHWHLKYLRAHQMFTEVERENDPCVKLMMEETERGKQVNRRGQQMFWAVFKRTN